jgi:hypothetical protein
MDEIEKLKNKLKATQIRSNRKKKHLRDMNEKLKLYQAIADAAISDAARWKAESDKYKLMYEKVLNATKV